MTEATNFKLAPMTIAEAEKMLALLQEQGITLTFYTYRKMRDYDVTLHKYDVDCKIEVSGKGPTFTEAVKDALIKFPALPSKE